MRPLSSQRIRQNYRALRRKTERRVVRLVRQMVARAALLHGEGLTWVPLECPGLQEQDGKGYFVGLVYGVTVGEHGGIRLLGRRQDDESVEFSLERDQVEFDLLLAVLAEVERIQFANH